MAHDVNDQVVRAAGGAAERLGSLDRVASADEGSLAPRERTADSLLSFDRSSLYGAASSPARYRIEEQQELRRGEASATWQRR